MKLQALTAASLSALSVVLSSSSETRSEKTAETDPTLFHKLAACLRSRAAKMFAFGLLFSGPTAHYCASSSQNKIK